MALPKALRSVRLSTYLIAALLTVYFLGLMIPQKGVLGREGVESLRESSPLLYGFLDSADFLDIYTSWLAIGLLVLFFVNLAAVLADRSRGILARCSPPVPRAPDPARSVCVDVGDKGVLAMQHLKSLLSGYALKAEGNMLGAVRNRFGPLGVLVFHLSFFPLLVAGLMLFYSRSAGEVHVTVGQQFHGTREEFAAYDEPLMGGPPSIGFKLVEVRPLYSEDKPVDLDVVIEVDEPGPGGMLVPARRTLKVNRPYVQGDTTVLIVDINAAPLISVSALPGAPADKAYVSLNVLDGKMDSYLVPGTDIRMDLVLYPDHFERDGLDFTRSFALDNPVFRAQIAKGGELIYEGLMRPGKSMEAGGMKFGIEDIRYWGKFIVVRERGSGPLWAGLILGFLGLVWRFMYPRTEVRAALDGSTLCIWARAEGLAGLSEDTARALAEKIEGFMGVQ